MALANYSDLQGAILKWMARNDADTQAALPDFINLAESAIKSRLPTLEGERTWLLTGDGGTDYTVPALLWQIRAIRGDYGGDYNLEYRTPYQWAFEKYDYDTAGYPSFIYTLRGNYDSGRQLQIAPAIASGTQLNIDYIARLNPLTANNTTNWLLTNFPLVYLTGAMVEAMGFERNYEGMNQWSARFTKALAEVEEYLNSERWGGAALTIRTD